MFFRSWTEFPVIAAVVFVERNLPESIAEIDMSGKSTKRYQELMPVQTASWKEAVCQQGGSLVISSWKSNVLQVNPT